MGTSFADRWGVPIQARSQVGVAPLDDAIEELAALAGDPVAAAEAAVAADDTLALGHIYRAYLSLYDTTAEGAASAAEILKKLTEADEPLAEREHVHLRAARAWAEGRWEAAARALEQALLLHPRDLLALKIAQDLYSAKPPRRGPLLSGSRGTWARDQVPGQATSDGYRTVRCPRGTAGSCRPSRQRCSASATADGRVRQRPVRRIFHGPNVSSRPGRQRPVFGGGTDGTGDIGAPAQRAQCRAKAGQGVQHRRQRSVRAGVIDPDRPVGQRAGSRGGDHARAWPR